MTLHKEFRKDSSEDLDILIRIALRESVVGAEPSPCVWGWIKERVRRLAMTRQPRGHIIFDLHLMLPSVARMSMFYFSYGDALRLR